MYKATGKDKLLAKTIIQEELNRHGLNVTEDVLNGRVDDVLSISYSIGGGYDEKTLRSIAISLIEKDCW